MLGASHSTTDSPFDLPRTTEYIRARKKAGSPRRVWFFRGNFFLEEESLRAFRKLGLAVRPWPVPPEWDAPAVAALMRGLVEFKPDLIFAINHLGFDKAGWLTRFLEQCQMPAAIWYVDNPDFIIRAYPENVSPWTAVFVWDKHYVTGLREMGFPLVTYLPLGTDPYRFRPYPQPPFNKFPARGAAFVGSSWSQRVKQQLAPFKEQQEKLAAIEAAAQRFRRSRHYFARNDLAAVYTGFSSLPLMEQINMEAAALWRASQLDRADKIGALTDAGLMVFGDAAWQQLLSDPEAYGGPINYQWELPAFYQTVSVNLNLTSLQMKEGLNQRVFDIPAAGAFLLTDAKEALWDLFAPDEVAVYRNVEEARDKLGYFPRQAQARREITARARKHILARHTIAHRLQNLLSEICRHFG